ncbi:MerR family transcriptional regulator [Cyanobacterium aponinum UTEX 3221]|uniref:MerR family transcriptional regulator n=1 Tax=Cyanobacterium aponinum TaxID=379064 RepID=UPI002B4BF20F|nr:MerR family transcriptional regulator [Cyanobacterium aponinum]WRL38168.1 MerR family transcriptional regulator [Cyanobacterium aponinum UTEX 3221]
MLQVKQVCQLLNINAQTLYYYERIGLIFPQRSDSGYRLFSPQDMETLCFILQVKSLGLTLEEIKELLNLRKDRSLSCQVVYDQLKDKIGEIEDKIRQLEGLKTALMPLLKQCEVNLHHPNPEHQCQVLNIKHE